MREATSSRAVMMSNRGGRIGNRPSGARRTRCRTSAPSPSGSPVEQHQVEGPADQCAPGVGDRRDNATTQPVTQ